MDVSARGLTLYAIWAGHQVSDLDSPVIALNRWCQALPCHSQQKPTLRIVSMFAPQDEHATPAHARNHAKDVNAASIDVSRLALPHTRGWVCTVGERNMRPLAARLQAS